MARKIIIDTDPGIDDAMAIFYALSSGEFDLLGLTTVFGNSTTDNCTINALRLLEIAERTDIPVAKGASRPLGGRLRGWADFVHGVDGQGDVGLPPPKTKPVDVSAAQFIVDQVMAAPGEVTLVPLAPLTNIAMAFLLKPDLGKYIKEIVLMGGTAYHKGNATPVAEANIHNDPEAADIVFDAECPVTMIGLDVTEKIRMTAAELATIGDIDSAEAQHLAKILPFYLDFHRTSDNLDGIYIHDSTTITYLLAPELFKTIKAPVRVETQGFSRGKTQPGFYRDDLPDWNERPEVTICVDVDVQGAIALEMSQLRKG